MAEKVTADYSSTKIELGVMDTDFQWVVPLSETFYHEVLEADMRSLGFLDHIDTLIDTYIDTVYTDTYSGIYIFDGKVWFAESKKCLNLKDGTFSINSGSFPSFTWRKDRWDQGVYKDYAGNIMADLSEHKGAEFWSDKFINGKVLVTFHNSNANTYYFTLIDEKGNFAFEPVEMKDLTPNTMYYDGEFVLAANNYENKIQTYDITGKLLGELNMNYSEVYIGDGVVTVACGSIGREFYYYNPDFTPLF